MWQDKIEHRIVEAVFWRDDEKLCHWLDSILGASDGSATLEDGVISFDNGRGFNGGFHYGLDPVTIAVMIASAITSPQLWTKAFPGLLRKIDKEWKAQSKARKQAKKEAS